MQSHCWNSVASTRAEKRSVAARATNKLQKAVVDDGSRYTRKQWLAGDNVGCLLRGVQRHEVERGMVLAKPGSIEPHANFEAKLYVLSKEEGGRHTPFLRGYRPQFYIRTADVTGAFTDFKDEDADDGSSRQMVLPGDVVMATVELGKAIPLEEGQRFAIREGKRTIGAGFVTKILT